MKMSSLFCSTHIVTERGRQKNRHEPQKQLTGKGSRAMLLTEESMERQVAFLVDASSQQRKPTLPARFSPCGAWPPAVRGTDRGAWHRRVTSLSLNSIAVPTSASFVCDSFFCLRFSVMTLPTAISIRIVRTERCTTKRWVSIFVTHLFVGT